ncbi:MAG TPA: hypothetical protein VF774_02410 [Pseudoduganella sp.]|jgi:hypothetical protein
MPKSPREIPCAVFLLEKHQFTEFTPRTPLVAWNIAPPRNGHVVKLRLAWPTLQRVVAMIWAAGALSPFQASLRMTD